LEILTPLQSRSEELAAPGAVPGRDGGAVAQAPSAVTTINRTQERNNPAPATTGGEHNARFIAKD
jgi:hypothetical protein